MHQDKTLPGFESAREYAHTEFNRCWLDVLEEYNVKHMALDPIHDRKLIKQLQTYPNWIVEFATEGAIFFVHEELSVGNRSVP